MSMIDSIVVVMLVCGMLFGSWLCWQEYQYSQLPIYKVECHLLSDYPREGEDCRTVWATGRFGTLTSHNRELYDNTREHMVLHIRQRKDDIRIVGFDD